jgi:murein DD-endopeptidase MepM/ murein hydrolase activator NlpD
MRIAPTQAKHAPRAPIRPRRAIARGAALLALALPASAVAAPPAGDGSGKPGEGRDGADSPADVAALIIGLQAGRSAEPPRPVNPVTAPVDYGTAINGFGNERGRPHEGQDMFAPEGTPVVSPTATEVLETGTDGGRGNWAALWDPAAKHTYVYMHMSQPADFAAGEELDAGQRVGLLGCTGSCDGAHLHFEIREGKSPYANPIDPLPELQRWQPAE